MSPTLQQNVTLEEAVDVIAELLLGPEFASCLQAEHEAARRPIAYRQPEWVYTEDIETPDGYPCCELIAVRVDSAIESTAEELDHNISCQWTVNGDDPQTMGRELKRLIASTRDFFKHTTLLPYIGGSVWSNTTDFGPAVTARAGIAGVSGRWIKSASLELHWKAFAR